MIDLLQRVFHARLDIPEMQDYAQVSQAKLLRTWWWEGQTVRKCCRFKGYNCNFS